MKKIIEKTISILKTATLEMERAYKETYGDYTLAKEFSKEIEWRKKVNKKRTLKKIADFVIAKTYIDDNIIMPEHQARDIANLLFEEAMKNGNIDELNRYNPN